MRSLKRLLFLNKRLLDGVPPRSAEQLNFVQLHVGGAWVKVWVYERHIEREKECEREREREIRERRRLSLSLSLSFSLSLSLSHTHTHVCALSLSYTHTTNRQSLESIVEIWPKSEKEKKEKEIWYTHIHTQTTNRQSLEGVVEILPVSMGGGMCNKEVCEIKFDLMNAKLRASLFDIQKWKGGKENRNMIHTHTHTHTTNRQSVKGVVEILLFSMGGGMWNKVWFDERQVQGLPFWNTKMKRGKRK